MDTRPAIHAPFLTDIHVRLLASAVQLENQANRVQETDPAIRAQLLAEARQNRASAEALIWTLHSFSTAKTIPVHGLENAR